MKNILLIIGLTLIIATGCDNKPEVEKKKEELKNAQSELKDLSTKISNLEKEIAALDPDFGKKEIKKTLITALNAEKKYFEHKVEVRGSVESRKNVTVSPEIPGKIKSILVKEGQKVQKGQTLLTLDASIIRNNIEELETSMELSKTVYERQANLWKKNIGTEIQYLQSKNNYESLERKLATLNSQLDQAIIKAPFDGSIDEVIAKEGEIAQPGMPLFRIVNPNDVYIRSDVSERFIGVFKSGDEVDVHFPSQNKTIVSTITSVGQVINSQNRTFEIQVAVPSGFSSIRPNQVVVLKLKDYINEEAITVPTMVILKDSKGSYVFNIVKEGSELVAKKAHIETGVSYNNATEILSGINPGQKIANKGVRDLAEGVLVSLNSNN
ncbi:efflux RND transporter periplasmic adaptor subunit [Reichenbachiella sp. MALMAid0571]|uniref:efflux RND transporter periplasmic adaptor subunit n=1 Tax=Reichenbachiella sp. MALMAid0571 TaxID=3143939 RepID=UPI0032DF5704